MNAYNVIEILNKMIDNNKFAKIKYVVICEKIRTHKSYNDLI